MKKLLFGLLASLVIGSASAQITDTSGLRSYINAHIIPNGSREISAQQLNSIFNAFINLWPAPGGGTSFDSATAQGAGSSGDFHTQNFNDARYVFRKDTAANNHQGFVTQDSRQKLVDSLINLLVARRLVSDTGGLSSPATRAWLYKVADSLGALITSGATVFDSASSQGATGSNGFHTQGYNDPRYLFRGDSAANNHMGFVTQDSRKKLGDSLSALLALKINKTDTAAGSFTYVSWPSRQKLADSLVNLILKRVLQFDTAANSATSYVTWKSRQKLADSIFNVLRPFIGTFTNTVNGLVPAPGTPSGKVLSDNGTWITPSGGGSIPDTLAADPAALVPNYRLNADIAAINSTVGNDDTIPNAGDTLYYHDDNGNANFKKVNVTSVDHTATIVDNTNKHGVSFDISVSGAGVAIAGFGQISVSAGDTVSLNDTAWHRKGTILTSPVGTNLAEASSIRWDSSSLLSLPPSDSAFRIYFTEMNAANTWPHVAYAESKTGAPGTWVRYSGSGDSVISGRYRGFVYHNTNATFGTKGWYYWGANIAETQIDEFYSGTGIPGSWSLLHSAVVTAASLGLSNVYNSSVAIDPSTNTWEMLLDGGQTTYGLYSDFLLSSTDGAGAVWTANATNPVLPRLAAPHLFKLGSTWYAWGLSTMNSADILPSDMYLYSSSNLTTWTYQGMVFPRLTADEGVNTTVGQAADPFLVPTANNVFLFYTAAPNGNSSGGGNINEAVFNGNMNQLVASTENIPLRSNWMNAPDGSIWFNQNVGIGKVSGLKFPLTIWENAGLTINGHNGASAIQAENFIGADNFAGDAIFGYNLFHTNSEGWQKYDSTAAGYDIQTNSSNINFWGQQSGGARLVTLPNLLGSMAYSTSLSLPVMLWNGHLNFGVSDDGSGNWLNMGGHPAEFTNITTNQINAAYYNLYSGTFQSGNLTAGQTKVFSSSYTGTSNTALNIQNIAATTMTQNVAIGFGAFGLGTTSSFNVLIGNQAGAALVTSGGNSIVGRDALVNATGPNNTGMGQEILRNIVAGGNNAGLGWEAGYQDNNGFASTNGSYRMVLGAIAQVTQDNSAVIGGVQSSAGALYVGIGQPSPNSYLQLQQGTQLKASLTFTYTNISTTAASGTGTVVTMTFSPQPFIPFFTGESVIVSGVTPSGYNGTFTVTACTTTTVTFLGTATGSQTVAGKIIVNSVLSTPIAGAVDYDANNLYWTNLSGVRDTFATRDWARSNLSASSSPVVFSQVVNGTSLTNSTTQTNVMGGTGSVTFAANTLQVGQTITVHGFFFVSTASSSMGTLSLGPSFAGGGTFIGVPISASMANAPLEYNCYITILTTGSSGTYTISQSMQFSNGANAVYANGAGTTGSINTTTSNNLSGILAQWSVASASNSIQSVPSFTVKLQ